jgi:transposase
MPRTHYTLIERTALGSQLHKGPLAVRHRKMMKLLRGFWQRISTDPTAVFALVEALAPDAPDLPAAYDQAQDRLERLHRDVMMIVSGTDIACTGARNRLNDFVDVAISRRIELERERKRIVRQLEEAGSESTKQRERLAAALAEIDEEHERLVRFVVTMDDQHLPAGFEDRVKAYRERREQRLAAVSMTPT